MMSKTFTSRPTATATRGAARGRAQPGRGRATNPSPGQPSNPPIRGRASSLSRGQTSVPPGRVRKMWEDSSPPPRRPGPPRTTAAGPPNSNPDPENPPNGASPEERMQRRDAYTVIAPNQQKRAAHASVAQKEEAEYKQYKEKKKVSHVAYVGTAGGGVVSEEATRVRQQHNQTNFRGAYARANQSRGMLKQQEEAENIHRKEEARKRTLANERKDGTRSANLRQEHRQTNTAFLDRLERDSKEKSRAKILRNAPAATSTQSENAACSSASVDAEHEDHHHGDPDPVDELTKEFAPLFDKEVIQAVLASVGGDTRQARRSLCEMGGAG